MAPRILIVDDELPVVRSLKMHFGDEHSNWVIVTAQDVEEGKRALQEEITNGSPIDVMLTDLDIRNSRGGMEMLEAARKIDPELLSILYTAKPELLQQLEAYKLGAFDVVDKNALGEDGHKILDIKTQAALQFRERSRQVSSLSRSFSPDVVEHLLSNPALLKMQARMITICFWDIRGFSAACETLREHPDLITGFLNEYYSAGADIILKHGGTLDKFIGDGIMALFGALNADAEKDDGRQDALNAVLTAMELKQRFDVIGDKWKKAWALEEGKHIAVDLGCGIHTGKTLVGNIGAGRREHYTALGRNVNIAARIEPIARNGEVLLSSTTNGKVAKNIVSSSFGIHELKNIGPFEVFNATALKPG